VERLPTGEALVADGLSTSSGDELSPLGTLTGSLDEHDLGLLSLTGILRPAHDPNLVTGLWLGRHQSSTMG